jgi:hypothetical protein
MGSTCRPADNPFIPYAILDGFSVEESNKARDERNKRREIPGWVVLGVYFGLPRG